MSFRLKIGLVTVAILGATSLAVSLNKQAPETLVVSYPLDLLEKDGSLFDPTNHDSIYTYYLAENVGAGLVRDDQFEPSGFKGVLAESWTWDGERTWRFRIRDDLRWSDGSPITAAQLLAHVNHLTSEQYRHVATLRGISRVTFDEPTNSLILEFSKHTGEAVLHELSLADSVLFQPDSSGKPTWSVSAGPYYLESFTPDKVIRLKKNRFFPLASDDSPNSVELLANSPPDNGPLTYPLNGADLANVPSPVFSAFAQNLISQAEKIKEGAWASIRFFSFNPAHELASQPQARSDLACLIHKTLSSFAFPTGVKFETQMVPSGYDGRLISHTAPKECTGALKGKKLSLQIPTTFLDLGEDFSARFKQTFAAAGVDLKLKFIRPFESNPENDHLARIQSFIGNQKDATGSWTFHFTKGSLAPFRDEYQSLLDQIASGDPETKRKGLLDLHREVLNRNHLIPIMIEQRAAAHSSRVSLDRWNPFDMRMRFYEVRWN